MLRQAPPIQGAPTGAQPSLKPQSQLNASHNVHSSPAKPALRPQEVQIAKSQSPQKMRPVAQGKYPQINFYRYIFQSRERSERGPVSNPSCICQFRPSLHQKTHRARRRKRAPLSLRCFHRVHNQGHARAENVRRKWNSDSRRFRFYSTRAGDLSHDTGAKRQPQSAELCWHSHEKRRLQRRANPSRKATFKRPRKSESILNRHFHPIKWCRLPSRQRSSKRPLRSRRR